MANNSIDLNLLIGLIAIILTILGVGVSLGLMIRGEKKDRREDFRDLRGEMNRLREWVMDYEGSLRSRVVWIEAFLHGSSDFQSQNQESELKFRRIDPTGPQNTEQD